MRRLSLFLLLSSLFMGLAQAQMAVGDWREHLPYREVIDVAQGNDLVFAATPFSVFIFNQNDNSIERLSKVTDLSDTGISSIAYDAEKKLLVVGYETGNLDLVYPNVTYNIGDIERSDLIGDKGINAIEFRGEFIYLACGFGIVQLDLQRREIKDTFVIGPEGAQVEVFDIEIFDGIFYAATAEGLYTADANDSFLANFANWDLDPTAPGVTDAFDRILVNSSIRILNREEGNQDDVFYQLNGTDEWLPLPGFSDQNVRDIVLTDELIYLANFNSIQTFTTEPSSNGGIFSVNNEGFLPLALSLGENGTIWIGSERRGLLRTIDGSSGESIIPDGPPFNNVRRIDCYNDNMWIASGGVNQSYVNNFLKSGFYGLANESWNYIPSPEGENEVVRVNDIMDVTIDPLDNSHIMFGSWEEGVIEVRNGEITEIYNENNSSIRVSTIHPDPRYMVAGVDFDDNGNCWVTSSFTNAPLHVRTAGGVWKSFSFSADINDSELIGEVLATREGQVWFTLPNRESLVVFDYNGTINNTADDRYRILTQEEGEGALPSDVFSMVEDLDGELWIGTLEGLAVFYTPLSIFGSGNNDAQQILIEQGGNIQILLETEAVTAMELDGGNRKWVGTANSGVFIFSEDGLDQIAHYTEENSPLLSNTINDIAINQRTGEVFISTEKGLISLMGTATNFDEEISNLTIYPNPVRPEHEGNIVIDGLAYKSDIKITDVSGNLVFSGTSNGGRAVWNGRDENGRRVTTGIYLVFASKQDGSATNVGKIAFIR